MAASEYQRGYDDGLAHRRYDQPADVGDARDEYERGYRAGAAEGREHEPDWDWYEIEMAQEDYERGVGPAWEGYY